ncbi:conserved hypothetical protein [Anaerobium acetethylicum]|uniref:Purine nucleoside phosphorylase n=2 Tax=Anaerobium acetethylicum TaxID=1619234 RepID=A0A1D3TPR2_9FIRM|nr:peptidoglycan editing factor PgeF [Anaerobium acetethylicum]SCP95432.1 conserved hypothetical protein [Anaerobium acetethylicum]
MGDMEFSRKEGGKHMELRIEKEVPFLVFPDIEESGAVKHGFSTRLGGVSRGIWSTMNLSFSRGDQEDDVRENFRRISEALGMEWRDLVFSDQVHLTEIRKATLEDRGKGIVRNPDYEGIDGLITDVPELPLVTFYADCVPLFFVDPVRKAIGLAHSGWKGTVGKIGKRTVEAMTREFGTAPEDLIAAIGPSICADCYEVSEDVAEAFRDAFTEEQCSLILTHKGNGKYQLDLWKANEMIMLEAGIRPEKISVTDLCTCCNPELLFSHRATKGKRGNLAAFLCLKGTEKEEEKPDCAHHPG